MFASEAHRWDSASCLSTPWPCEPASLFWVKDLRDLWKWPNMGEHGSGSHFLQFLQIVLFGGRVRHLPSYLRLTPIWPFSKYLEWGTPVVQAWSPRAISALLRIWINDKDSCEVQGETISLLCGHHRVHLPKPGQRRSTLHDQEMVNTGCWVTTRTAQHNTVNCFLLSRRSYS